jgi:hypothetical protein
MAAENESLLSIKTVAGWRRGAIESRNGCAHLKMKAVCCLLMKMA